jgi:hypothetical protein
MALNAATSKPICITSGENSTFNLARVDLIYQKD